MHTTTVHLTWNQKHLDYEIETGWHRRHPRCGIRWSLKSKASRLRDWNVTAGNTGGESSRLKSKASRLRDWNKLVGRTKIFSQLQTWNQKHFDYEIETRTLYITLMRITFLEIKSISITRLKQEDQVAPRDFRTAWNQKHLDYEIETNDIYFHRGRTGAAWNQKHLDYEIETNVVIIVRVMHQRLEIKSISITRLKPTYKRTPRWRPATLEIKSISITRLKLAFTLPETTLGLSWNQKHLDYEIETSSAPVMRHNPFLPWNQKHLDYEIETTTCFSPKPSSSTQLEIKSILITRLKQS